MQQFGAREVEKLLRLPRRTIRSLISAGFVKPSRGPRNAWQFSFQDLILLRTAQALVDANVPARNIVKSLRQLRQRLPESMPLSGLRLRAVGDRVVVSERNARWQADSGQYLLAFDGDPGEGSLGVIAAQTADEPSPTDADWFERGVALEQDDISAARQAYERAILADPARLDARINLGRLLHAAGQLAHAERVYRQALDVDVGDALLHFNFAVLLEDMRRKNDAMRSYEAAVKVDPSLADAHYNLALLYEDLGRPKDAIRHMASYRRLTRA